MKFVEPPSAFTDPDTAARRLVEIASTIEAVQDGRIFVELINSAWRHAGSVPRRAGARDQSGLALAS
jgi:hypothetical protein